MRLLFASIVLAAGLARAEAPPRAADIAAILDQEKPNPGRIAFLRREAAAEPPAGMDGAALRDFFYRRAQMRNLLGRSREAFVDIERAAALLGSKVSPEAFRIMQFRLVLARVDPRGTLQLLDELERLHAPTNKNNVLINIYRHTIDMLVLLGDIERAEKYLEKSIALFEKSAAKSDSRDDLYRSSWAADLELSRALVLEARGRFAEAEVALVKSEALRRDSLRMSEKWPSSPPRASFVAVIDATIGSLGRVKAWQGRLHEAETEMRRALLNRLRVVGKYHVGTALNIRLLSRVLIEQGRYAEAERLLRASAEIYATLGVPPLILPVLRTRTMLARTLASQERWAEAAQLYADVDRSIADWPAARREAITVTGTHILALYQIGRIEDGVALARRLLRRERANVGERHYDFVMAQALLAAGLAQSGKEAEALAAYRAAMPLLISSATAGAEGQSVTSTDRDRRLRMVVEPYLALLARAAGRGDAAAIPESFAVADAIRGRAVRAAVAAAGARVMARDPKLAAVVRNEQDLAQRITAGFSLLADVLSLPPHQRVEAKVEDLRAQIAALRKAHAAARAERETRFPEYADLVDPKPPSVAEVQRALRPGEAFVSFYFGAHSFVWVVPQTGPVAFAEIGGTAAAIEAKVKALRRALEPNASTVEDIPAVDLALAHEIYRLLLEPVSTAWRPAKNLIVATNGSLGLLPLGLLPIAPAVPPVDAQPLFAAYRNVPWLARTHAVTMVPSTASLLTLRRLPPGSAARERIIGFGDPFFNGEQAAESERPAGKEMAAATATRGLPLRLRAAPATQGVDSAELGLLPRLPDTADELRAVALALAADPAKVLFLGKAANEARVKSSDLSRFRIVAFATHGLVPGDLNGLTQPALALTAPKVAGVDGDGLLTMEEILALKLDADWVVLSACNTASGAEAGAEAASGLGRAFFYAGTRAILVTNWSVHSASARELVTDLFRRQAADASITRAEALRQAMMEMLDRGGYVDDAGKILFTYAHPLFWAPYTIIGDAGAN